jgi:serine/threonine protein kinase
MTAAIAEFLSSVRGFSQLDLDDLEKAAKHTTEMVYGPQERLIKRGAPGDSMIIIREGDVRIPIIDATGRERTVVKLGPGDVVGEMALLTGERRNADVIAIGEVRALILERHVIAPLLADNPPLARFLTEILGQRLESGGGISQVGKYKLLGKLGEGATSKVYEALHPGLNRTVALKMLGHHLVYDKAFKDRFIEEARTIASLNHPNIVQVFDTEQAYATYFLVMEKVEGADLKDRLDGRGKLDAAWAADILGQVAAALSFAHARGIIHRDVKPANVAVDMDGNAKLMDFGIAQRTRSQQASNGIVEGTPKYLAPEAIRGQPVDERADIYALGVMAFEMLASAHPFPANTLEELLQAHCRRAPPDIARLRPDLPEHIVRFVKGAMRKDPDKRLRDWGKIKALLAGGAAADLTMDRMDERIIRIRYRPQDRQRIDRAIKQFERSLMNLQFSDIRQAELRDPSAEPDTPLDATGSGTFTGLFNKLRGKDDETQSNFEATRAFKSE